MPTSKVDVESTRSNPIAWKPVNQPPSTSPIIDEVTKKLTAARRSARLLHQFRHRVRCSCGATCAAQLWVMPVEPTAAEGSTAHQLDALCIHKVAWHRSEVSPEDIRRILALPYGMATPTPEELAYPR